MQRKSDQAILAMIHRLVDLRDRHVLEIGCGDGRITSGLMKQPARLVAIDPDAARIEQARLKMPAVDFRIGSGEALEFSDEAFDLVLFTLSLHHQQPRRALAEAARVLRLDGRILVIEPVSEGEVERVFAVLDDETEVTRQAQAAVTASGLLQEHAEIFHGRWIFDDQQDLVDSLFAYYDRTFEARTAAALLEALGGKREDRPIVLSDRLLIQVLCK